jgi:hypothetical protein
MERNMPHESLDRLIRKLESVTRLSEDERKSLLDLPVRVTALRAEEDIVREAGAIVGAIIIHYYPQLCP